MAYVYKRGNVYWIGYTDAGGIKRQEPTKARSKVEARDVATELERKAFRVKKGLEPAAAADITYRQAVAKYLGSLSKDYESRQTIEGNFTNRILPHLGDLGCRSMKPADVRQMLKANEEEQWTTKDGKPFRLKPASPATREKLRIYVQASFRYLIEELQVVFGQNPAQGKRMRVQVPKKFPKHLSVADTFKLLQAVPEHRRFHFAFAVATGVRKGEGLGLEWADVHEDQRFVLIATSHGRSTTKTKREREVPIPLWLVPLVEAARADRISRFVFPNADGHRQSRWVKLHNVMKTALKNAGLVRGYEWICRRKGCGWREQRETGEGGRCPKCEFKLWVEPIPRDLSFKDLRSTFGTLAQSQTGNIAFVQAVLGHAKIQTTRDSYVRTLREDLVDGVDEMNWGALGGMAKALPAVSDLSVTAKVMTVEGVSRSESVSQQT